MNTPEWLPSVCMHSLLDHVLHLQLHGLLYPWDYPSKKYWSGLPDPQWVPSSQISIPFFLPELSMIREGLLFAISEHFWLRWCVACIRGSDYSQFSTKIQFFSFFYFEDTLKHEVLYSLFQLKLVPSSKAVKIFVLMISLSYPAALYQILGLWPLFPKMTCVTLVWVAIFSLLLLLLLTWNFHPMGELGKSYQGPSISAG